MGPYWKRGQVLLLRLHFFQKEGTPCNFISVACLKRRLFSQIHESWEEAMASTACPFCEGGKKDVFSTLASLFAFSRASFSNSAAAAKVFLGLKEKLKGKAKIKTSERDLKN